MPHDDPAVGKIIEADWGVQLDTQGLYVPVLTASSTAPNLGADGEATGLWHRSGHLITGWAQFHFSGSGVDPGAGSYQVSLPFDADISVMDESPFHGVGSPLGSANMRDASAVNSSRTGVSFLGSPGRLRIQIADDGIVSNDAPWIWAGDDRIICQFAYLADPAGLPT